MTVAATGPQGTALEKLVWALANSSAFQERCKLTDATPSVDRIHWPYLETEIDTVENSRPCAIVEEADYSWNLIADNTFQNGGAFDLTITDNDRHEGDPKASAMDFRNFVDGVLTDLVSLPGTDDTITMQSIRQTQFPMRSHPTQDRSQRGYWSVKYRVTWGVSGSGGGE